MFLVTCEVYKLIEFTINGTFHTETKVETDVNIPVCSMPFKINGSGSIYDCVVLNKKSPSAASVTFGSQY